MGNPRQCNSVCDPLAADARRMGNLIVRLHFRLRVSVVVYFALSITLLWFVRYQSCRSYIQTWAGMLPVQVGYLRTRRSRRLVWQAVAEVVARPEIVMRFCANPAIPTSVCGRAVASKYARHSLMSYSCCFQQSKFCLHSRSMCGTLFAPLVTAMYVNLIILPSCGIDASCPAGMCCLRACGLHFP
jgi:hypothetical protein